MAIIIHHYKVASCVSCDDGEAECGGGDET